MKRLLTGFLTVFLLVLTSNIATAQQQETSEKHKVLGVLMHAEWCSKYKQLDPKLSEVNLNLKKSSDRK